MIDLSRPLEDYLFDIFQLWNQQHDENALLSANDVMMVSGTTLSSVNRAINALREKALIEHLPYQGIRLTQAGLSVILPRLHKHRIIETFLYRQMHLDWHLLHSEARSMSGAVSYTITERMWMLMDHPQYSPYGECIPQLTDTLTRPDDLMLHHAPLNTPSMISRVVSRDQERLKYIHALHLLPETRIEVIHVAPFDGPMQLRLNNEYRIVGRSLAEFIRIRSA